MKTMDRRTICRYFAAGPARLPAQVLTHIKDEILDPFGLGISILEISHRSSEYEELNDQTLHLLRDVLQVPDSHEVMLSVLGAQQHFSVLVDHLSEVGDSVAYARTGIWANLAVEAARRKERNIVLAFDGERDGYRNLGCPAGWKLPNNAKYIHLTVNNTAFGTEFREIPTFTNTPLVLDMTSSIAARTDIPWAHTGLIYASAQKNLGIAGVSVVIMRKDLLEQSRFFTWKNRVGDALSYSSLADTRSIFNTPPVFAVFCLNRMLVWIKSLGGVKEMQDMAWKKANLIYQQLDRGPYFGTSAKTVRSRHNCVFRLASETEDRRFITLALANDLRGIEGHKAVGGIRVSLYNGIPEDAAQDFAEFMRSFSP